MAENKEYVPPRNPGGISRPGRGGVVVKPKNMKGTLGRLWQLTRGHRKGLGWIFLLSGLASGASVLSPYVTGKAVTAISGGDALTWILVCLTGAENRRAVPVFAAGGRGGQLLYGFHRTECDSSYSESAVRSD